MAKDKNYYKILGEGRPCNLLKTSQINPAQTHFSVLSTVLSKLDGCILYQGNIFYVNQQKKTCQYFFQDHVLSVVFPLLIVGRETNAHVFSQHFPLIQDNNVHTSLPRPDKLKFKHE